jgi:hypothetical protein
VIPLFGSAAGRASFTRSVVAMLCVAAAVGAQRAAAEESFVDFLYIDANEDSASGGHVALRLGDRTFHFGHHAPGFLRLDRDDSATFERVYGTLENRNIRILRVPVSPEVHARLRGSFNERFLVESEEFAALENLARDRAFATAWAAGRPDVGVRGADYFGAARTPGARGEPEDVLLRLRRLVLARVGSEALVGMEERARRTLERLAVEAREPIAVLAAEGRHPPLGYGLRQRASDARSMLEALDVLERAAPLREGTWVEIPAEVLPVEGRLRERLAAHAQRIERGLIAAFSSPRRDLGFVVLAGMARLRAIERSLQGGRLVVLDVFPQQAMRISVAEIGRQGGRLPLIAEALAGELVEVGGILEERSLWRESDYGALELLAGRYREIHRAIADGSDVRVLLRAPLPDREARRPIGEIGVLPVDVASRRIEALQARERALSTRLLAQHRYHLLDHNCVSELFAQIERAVAEPGVAPREASRALLGGHVAPHEGLSFIPFVGAASFARELPVVASIEKPSYRRRRVAKMVSEEGMVARLRESNVLTSTIYIPNSLDSSFLFFTDERVATRPLFGVANLLWGVAATAGGLPLAPFDGGQRLASGLRGVLWSLPELAFFNVRKGSFFFVPDESGAGMRQDAPGAS